MPVNQRMFTAARIGIWKLYIYIGDFDRRGRTQLSDPIYYPETLRT
jgi:hypothetical protein